jgi:hypothetical protein
MTQSAYKFSSAWVMYVFPALLSICHRAYCGENLLREAESKPAENAEQVNERECRSILAVSARRLLHRGIEAPGGPVVNLDVDPSVAGSFRSLVHSATLVPSRPAPTLNDEPQPALGSALVSHGCSRCPGHSAHESRCAYSPPVVMDISDPHANGS